MKIEMGLHNPYILYKQLKQIQSITLYDIYKISKHVAFLRRFKSSLQSFYANKINYTISLLISDFAGYTSNFLTKQNCLK